MLDAGTYRAKARAESAQFGIASTGSEQIAVDLVLLGEHDEETTESITWIGSFGSERAIEVTTKALRTLGWRGDSVFDLDGLGSEVVEIVVELEQYGGALRPRVRWINKVGGSSFKFKNELDDAGRRALELRVRAIMGNASPAAKPAAPRAAAPKPAARPAPVKASAGSDDVPF